MPPGDTVDLTHRQLAELQRTLATKATQLEQLSIDLSRLLGAAGGPLAPSSALIDPTFRRAWDGDHAADLRRLVAALEDQARHVGAIRRHLLSAAGDPAVAER